MRLHKGRATVPIGPPIGNVHMYVLDANKQPLPVGVPGELMISSLQLARGYLKRDDLTQEKFIDNPYGGDDRNYSRMYRTGDRMSSPSLCTWALSKGSGTSAHHEIGLSWPCTCNIIAQS